MKKKFDLLDKQILLILQNRAELSNKQLAALTNRSPTTIFGRIKKLFKSDLILRTRAELNGKLLGFGIIGFIYLKISNHSRSNLELFKTKLEEIKGVSSCTSITGQNSLKIKIATYDTTAFNRIKTSIADLQGVTVVDSYVELEDIIPDRGFDLI